MQPELKAVLVYDASTGELLENVACLHIAREYGDIAFQPGTAPGTYEVYFLPYNPGTSNFDEAGAYFPPRETADADWLKRNGMAVEDRAGEKWRSLPQAEVLEIQARNEFNRFDPMEVIATAEETRNLIKSRSSESYLLFPEDRKYPIRMFDDMPLRWVKIGPRESFEGNPQPGEYYVFQIGVYAGRKAIEDLSLTFSGLQSPNGKAIPPSSFHCINLGGSDWLGRPIVKRFQVNEGKVGALWIGVQIPRDATGVCTGRIEVQPLGAEHKTIDLKLTVSGSVLEDGGVNDLWRMARLKWLDSTLGLDDEVIPPYTPLVVEASTIRCLNREVRFGSNGLPESISSNGRQILAGPIALKAQRDGRFLMFAPADSRTLKTSPGVVINEYNSVCGPLAMTTTVKMEADGCLLFDASLKAATSVLLDDLALEILLNADVAKYMMGLGKRGGLRPLSWTWRWDINRVDNMVWLGDVDAGLQLKLLGPDDVWQIMNQKDAGIPDSWGNGGLGGCNVLEEGHILRINAFTGKRKIKAGESLDLRFRLLITPFKPIDPNHWNWRPGSNILHVHHATPENPYINYPFLTSEDLVRLVRDQKNSRTDLGELDYPAEGNLDLNSGSIHVWTCIRFDPQALVNQDLVSVDFPNQDSLCFYWNRDERGIRALIRKGAPVLNQYPAMFTAGNLPWKREERHIITLSWGESLCLFMDGRLAATAQYKGSLQDDLKGARIRISGGFGIEAIKIQRTSHVEGAVLEPKADENTLLLDTFSRWEGERKTLPDRIAPGGFGSLSPVFQKQDGPLGKEILFGHPAGTGITLYYTVRELSNHVVEMWPLRALGDEIFTTGESLTYFDKTAVVNTSGGGYPWLREHLVSGYVPAWRQPLFNGETDAAIATQGLSRLHNYYVEGLAWLLQNTGIDGLYLDGIGYDREIMKRVAKTMRRNNPESRINFHGGNNYDWLDGKSSTMNIYMEHFPYISNLWFGEFFDYDNTPPDYWLVEISGIPFGLTGEMLQYQNGGNPYRGMLYGMTGRLHPSCAAMYRFWDEFGIRDANMIGYWSPECPVKTGNSGILATVYIRPERTLIALGSWAKEKVDLTLTIDWKFLGLDPAKTVVTAPAIASFQEQSRFSLSEAIPVKPGEGWLLVLEESK